MCLISYFVLFIRKNAAYVCISEIYTWRSKKYFFWRTKRHVLSLVEGVKTQEKVDRYRFVNSSVDEAQNTSVAWIDDINTPRYLRNSVILGSSKEIVAFLSKLCHEAPAVPTETVHDSYNTKRISCVLLDCSCKFIILWTQQEVRSID